VFRWLAVGGGRGEVVVAAAEGVADGCGGRRRKRGRRASPAASGRQPFCGTATSSGSLLFPPSRAPSPSPSRSPSDLGTSLHALIAPVFLVLPVSPRELLFSSSSFPSSSSSSCFLSCSVFLSARLSTRSRCFLNAFIPVFHRFHPVLVHIFKGVILTIAYISIVYKCPLLVRLSDLALHKVSNVCSLRTPVRFFCLFFDSCFFDSSHIAPRVITYIYIYT